MSSFVSDNELLLKSWDYKKNIVSPNEANLYSHNKFWWICDKGHSYEQVAYSKAKGIKCPYCSNQKVLKGYNDLGTLYPDIVQYWDNDKNKKTPFEVASKSNKSAWWICDKGHSYSMPIYVKTRGNFHSCPICNKYKRVSVPEKFVYYYLKDKFDDVIENYKPDWIKPKEIDIFIPSINLGIEYDGFRYHQNKEKDKEKDKLCFDNGIKLLRIRELKCPLYESDSIKINLTEMYSQSYGYLEYGIKKLFEYLKLECDINIIRDLPEVLKLINIGNKNNCIAITNPEVLDEWDYDRNEKMNITPFNITKGTNIKAFWICSKGHSYQASIGIKTNQHTGCPFCTNKQILKGYNDVESQYPKLMKEWDYEKNIVKPDNITKGYVKKVHWICSKGHSFSDTIVNRLSGCNCPYCSGHQTLTGFNDIESQYPELMKEWDYEKNIELGINPRILKKGSFVQAYWICGKGHSYFARISGRIHGTGCPYCSGKKVLKGFNDLSTTNPELVKEWDDTKNSILPEDVTIGSRENVWWICQNGHSYQSKVCNRVHGRGCPYCSNNKILIGFNDLATTHPEVLVNWDYDKNSEIGITPYNISKSYSKKVWWKCDKGHSYQREVYNQRIGYGRCPICKRNKQL